MSDLALRPCHPLRVAGRRAPTGMPSNLLIWRHHICASRCLAISADMVSTSLYDSTELENAFFDSLTADIFVFTAGAVFHVFNSKFRL